MKFAIFGTKRIVRNRELSLLQTFPYTKGSTEACFQSSLPWSCCPLVGCLSFSGIPGPIYSYYFKSSPISLRSHLR